MNILYIEVFALKVLILFSFCILKNVSSAFIDLSAKIEMYIHNKIVHMFLTSKVTQLKKRNFRVIINHKY